MSWWSGDQVTGMWILWTLAAVLMVLASWFAARILNTAAAPDGREKSPDIRLAVGNGSADD